MISTEIEEQILSFLSEFKGKKELDREPERLILRIESIKNNTDKINFILKNIDKFSKLLGYGDAEKLKEKNISVMKIDMHEWYGERVYTICFYPMIGNFCNMTLYLDGKDLEGFITEYCNNNNWFPQKKKEHESE